MTKKDIINATIRSLRKKGLLNEAKVKKHLKEALEKPTDLYDSEYHIGQRWVVVKPVKAENNSVGIVGGNNEEANSSKPDFMAVPGDVFEVKSWLTDDDWVQDPDEVAPEELESYIVDVYKQGKLFATNMFINNEQMNANCKITGG